MKIYVCINKESAFRPRVTDLLQECFPDCEIVDFAFGSDYSVIDPDDPSAYAGQRIAVDKTAVEVSPSMADDEIKRKLAWLG